jgi:hypothetical protein
LLFATTSRPEFVVHLASSLLGTGSCTHCEHGQAVTPTTYLFLKSVIMKNWGCISAREPSPIVPTFNFVLLYRVVVLYWNNAKLNNWGLYIGLKENKCKFWLVKFKIETCLETFVKIWNLLDPMGFDIFTAINIYIIPLWVMKRIYQRFLWTCSLQPLKMEGVQSSQMCSPVVAYVCEKKGISLLNNRSVLVTEVPCT